MSGCEVAASVLNNVLMWILRNMEWAVVQTFNNKGRIKSLETNLIETPLIRITNKIQSNLDSTDCMG
jgi:hypothetical protein